MYSPNNYHLRSPLRHRRRKPPLHQDKKKKMVLWGTNTTHSPQIPPLETVGSRWGQQKINKQIHNDLTSRDVNEKLR